MPFSNVATTVCCTISWPCAKCMAAKDAAMIWNSTIPYLRGASRGVMARSVSCGQLASSALHYGSLSNGRGARMHLRAGDVSAFLFGCSRSMVSERRRHVHKEGALRTLRASRLRGVRFVQRLLEATRPAHSAASPPLPTPETSTCLTCTVITQPTRSFDFGLD